MRLIDADAFDERVRAAGGMSEEELSEDFKDGVQTVLYMMSKQPTITAQPERKWIPCSNPPRHHRDVLVRGKEAIGNVTVHKVMQWDADTWRPMDYAPSIIWKEWSEI